MVPNIAFEARRGPTGACAVISVAGAAQLERLCVTSSFVVSSYVSAVEE